MGFNVLMVHRYRQYGVRIHIRRRVLGLPVVPMDAALERVPSLAAQRWPEHVRKPANGHRHGCGRQITPHPPPMFCTVLNLSLAPVPGESTACWTHTLTWVVRPMFCMVLNI